MRVSELEGAVLDYWVARALRSNARLAVGFVPKYSANWAHGGPIIEREGIHLRPLEGAIYHHVVCNGAASLTGEWGSFHFAPTMLIAAMRAFVASKFGAEVADVGSIPTQEPT